jgi:hypothetical protein
MQREHGILERGCSIYIRDFQTFSVNLTTCPM